ncbi:MAG: hypothetical protein MUC55_15320 [Burkholderiales bacterium]|jgi:hypothetical protein|nr:hypothetical protein [Burkholderiales bacterium]
MRPRRSRLAGLALGIGCLATLGMVFSAETARAGAEPVAERRCEGGAVVVRSPSDADAATACGAASRAIAFLDSQGLRVPAEVTVEIAPKLPEIAGPSAVGCYLVRENRVVVLTYAAFRQFGDWSGLPIDRELYASLIAHEVTQAVAACNFVAKRPPIEATEYIAYVTMLSTMEPGLRSRVLGKFPGSGFEEEIEINATVYMLDPMRFGAQAYRRYLKPGDGREFLRAVVEGRALASGIGY